MLVYIGSMPAQGGGAAAGISVFAPEGGGGGGGLRPVAGGAEVAGPSFLAVHPRLPVMYAVDSVADGAVLAFAIEPGGALRPLGSRPSGGSEPVHVAVSADGRFLLCANWGSGGVAVLPLKPDGTLNPPSDVAVHDGKAHAHHVSLVGDQVTVVHLGANALYGHRLTPFGRLRPTWATPAQPKAGPRHLAVHPSGRRYVADELGATLSTYVPDPATGALRRVDSRPATLAEPDGPNYLSEVAVSADGRFVYVANRGPDTITTFAADAEVPVALDEVPTGGAFPRHFAVAGEWMYVANERSDTVTVLRLDDGLPRPTGHAVATPRPSCVLPLP
jgi:6-phosphogluconolactonase